MFKDTWGAVLLGDRVISRQTTGLACVATAEQTVAWYGQTFEEGVRSQIGSQGSKVAAETVDAAQFGKQFGQSHAGDAEGLQVGRLLGQPCERLAQVRPYPGG